MCRFMLHTHTSPEVQEAVLNDAYTPVPRVHVQAYIQSRSPTIY